MSLFSPWIQLVENLVAFSPQFCSILSFKPSNSQNHRIVSIVMDLWRSSSPTPTNLITFHPESQRIIRLEKNFEIKSNPWPNYQVLSWKENYASRSFGIPLIPKLALILQRTGSFLKCLPNTMTDHVLSYHTTLQNANKHTSRVFLKWWTTL